MARDIPPQSDLMTSSAVPDGAPLLRKPDLVHRRIFYPLGLPVEIKTNSLEILKAASETWGSRICASSDPPLEFRLILTVSNERTHPPTPVIRREEHLLSVFADTANFVLCDLRQGFASGSVTEAALRSRSYLRYYFLDAVALSLLSCSRVTALHAACVSFAGAGILFCGDSGAGKSTLAYACARAGWTFTSDDASYLLLKSTQRKVRGNANQLRFRPSARKLFPELHGLSLTIRAHGKPSIEVPTAELPGIAISQDAIVQHIVLLNRQNTETVELTPLTRDEVFPHFERWLFPPDEMRQFHLASLEQLFTASMFEMRYKDLETAVASLERLVQERL